MDGLFGANLRRLRQSRDMTQEQLAETLGVTPQAVSRWECGATFPDVTLLPGLAIFFDVSLDELMGMAALRSAGRLQDVHRRVQMLVEGGDRQSALELLRENLRLYPGDTGLRIALCETLAAGDTADSRNEAIGLGERLLENGEISMKARSTIAATLIHLYRLRGDMARAAELAGALPHIWECRELLLPEAGPEDQRAAALRRAIIRALGVLGYLADSAAPEGVPPHIQLGVAAEEWDPAEILARLSRYLNA